MPRTEQEIVEGLDTTPELNTNVRQLYEKQFRNFRTDQGRFPGQKVLIHFYSSRMPGEQFAEVIRKHLESEIYPVEIHFEQGVGVGNQRPKSSMGIEAVTALWRKDLPDSFLRWIKKQVDAIDKELDGWRA